MAQDPNTSELKLGMVFYRDRGDAFVTKRILLTTDIDAVYGELLALGANGGGDSPESVNLGLYEAIMDNQWSENKNVYKTIWIVGDCPPHMDYEQEVKYTESCKIAANKGIIINTIKLGNSCSDAIYHFKKMAECSGGDFLKLSQEAQDLIVSTPYDDQINKTSMQIEQSKVYYGSEKQKDYNYNRKSKAIDLYSKSTSTAQSQRSAYNTSTSGMSNWMGKNELLEDCKNGKVDIKNLKEEELPKEYKGKSKEEVLKIVETALQERENLVKQLRTLNQERAGFIKAEKAKNRSKESFSDSVSLVMMKQKRERLGSSK